MSKIKGEFVILEEDIIYQDFVRVAQNQGWVKQLTNEGDGNKDSFQEIWTTQDGVNAISYIDDPITITRFLWVQGPDLRELLFEILRRLPAYEPEELIQMAVSAPDENEAVRALFRIAVAFPNFNSAAFQVFQIYLTHPHPLVRKATVQAMAYRLWNESIRLIQEITQTESNEDTRNFAKTILEQTQNQPD